jgi:hypothetical protein
LHQWLICIVAALAAPLLTEIRKLVLRRREADAPQAPAGAQGTLGEVQPL